MTDDPDKTNNTEILDFSKFLCERIIMHTEECMKSTGEVMDGHISKIRRYYIYLGEEVAKLKINHD